jgi:hypothetical protein
MMAKMALGDEADIRGRIAERVFVTAQEHLIGLRVRAIAYLVRTSMTVGGAPQLCLRQYDGCQKRIELPESASACANHRRI